MTSIPAASAGVIVTIAALFLMAGRDVKVADIAVALVFLLRIAVGGWTTRVRHGREEC